MAEWQSAGYHISPSSHPTMNNAWAFCRAPVAFKRFIQEIRTKRDKYLTLRLPTKVYSVTSPASGEDVLSTNAGFATSYSVQRNEFTKLCFVSDGAERQFSPAIDHPCKNGLRSSIVTTR